MAGRRILRLAAAGTSLVALAAACGQTATRGESTKAAAQPGAEPAYTAQNGSFSVAIVPRGFTARRAMRHVDGPIVGQSYDAQDFLNESAMKKFTVTVHHNSDVALFTDPTQTLHPMPSDRKVQGRNTYSAFNGLSQQREIFWVIDAATLAYVIGSNMTDDELLAVAEGVRISQ
jgi:hypothetical protein